MFPLISVSNVYNCDAYPRSKNMILIARDSIINDIKETRFSINIKSVKGRYFSVKMYVYPGMYCVLERKMSNPLTSVIQKKYEFNCD